MRKARIASNLALFFILAGLGLWGQLARSTYGSGDGSAPPPFRIEDVPAADRPFVQIVEGIPVARLGGTPFEMGRRHGAIFKKQIHHLVEHYFGKLVFPLVMPGALDEWAARVRPYIPEHLMEELRGLAAGAELDFRMILIVNTMVDRFQNFTCSTLTASGSRTVEGEVYFGRNLDFVGGGLLHRSSIVLVFEPEGGTALVSVTWPGLVGVLSGMNAHGVAGATMMIHGTGEDLPYRPGIPYMMMYREALSKARRAADVHKAIEASRRTCANNFTVVDETGTSFVTEFTAEKALRRNAIDGAVCSTNFFVLGPLKDYGRAVGEDRFQTLAGFLEAHKGRIGLNEVRQALVDVAKPWYLNVQSMIFLPRRRMLYLAVGNTLPAAKQAFVALKKDVLFGGTGGGS